MFITIGAKNYNGDPIIYDREAMTKEVIFNLLSTATATSLPAITGEDYKRIHEEYNSLLSGLEGVNDQLSDTLHHLFQSWQDLLWTALDQAYERGFRDGQEFDSGMDCMQERQDRAVATLWEQQAAADLPPIPENERPFWDELHSKLDAYAQQEGIPLMEAAQRFAAGIKAQRATDGADQATTAPNKVGISESWVEAQEQYCNYFDTYMETFHLNVVQSLGLRQLCDFAEAFARIDVEARGAGLIPEEMLRLYDQLMTECWGPDWREQKGA